MSGDPKFDPTPEYVEQRVGRDVRLVRRSGLPDVIGRLERFDGERLVVEEWDARRTQVSVDYGNVAALYVRG